MSSTSADWDCLRICCLDGSEAALRNEDFPSTRWSFQVDAVVSLSKAALCVSSARSSATAATSAQLDPMSHRAGPSTSPRSPSAAANRADGTTDGTATSSGGTMAVLVAGPHRAQVRVPPTSDYGVVFRSLRGDSESSTGGLNGASDGPCALVAGLRMALLTAKKCTASRVLAFVASQVAVSMADAEQLAGRFVETGVHLDIVVLGGTAELPSTSAESLQHLVHSINAPRCADVPLEASGGTVSGSTAVSSTGAADSAAPPAGGTHAAPSSGSAPAATTGVTAAAAAAAAAATTSVGSTSLRPPAQPVRPVHAVQPVQSRPPGSAPSRLPPVGSRLIYLPAPHDLSLPSYQLLAPLLEQLDFDGSRESDDDADLQPVNPVAVARSANIGSSSSYSHLSRSSPSFPSSSLRPLQPHRGGGATAGITGGGGLHTSGRGAGGTTVVPGTCRYESLDSLQHLSADGFLRSWLPSYSNIAKVVSAGGGVTISSRLVDGRDNPKLCYISVYKVQVPKWHKLLEVSAGRVSGVPLEPSSPASVPPPRDDSPVPQPAPASVPLVLAPPTSVLPPRDGEPSVTAALEVASVSGSRRRDVPQSHSGGNEAMSWHHVGNNPTCDDLPSQKCAERAGGGAGASGGIGADRRGDVGCSGDGRDIGSSAGGSSGDGGGFATRRGGGDGGVRSHPLQSLPGSPLASSHGSMPELEDEASDSEMDTCDFMARLPESLSGRECDDAWSADVAVGQQRVLDAINRIAFGASSSSQAAFGFLAGKHMPSSGRRPAARTAGATGTVLQMRPDVRRGTLSLVHSTEDSRSLKLLWCERDADETDASSTLYGGGYRTAGGASRPRRYASIFAGDGEGEDDEEHAAAEVEIALSITRTVFRAVPGTRNQVLEVDCPYPGACDLRSASGSTPRSPHCGSVPLSGGTPSTSVDVDSQPYMRPGRQTASRTRAGRGPASHQLCPAEGDIPCSSSSSSAQQHAAATGPDGVASGPGAPPSSGRDAVGNSSISGSSGGGGSTSGGTASDVGLLGAVRSGQGYRWLFWLQQAFVDVEGTRQHGAAGLAERLQALLEDPPDFDPSQYDGPMRRSGQPMQLGPLPISLIEDIMRANGKELLPDGSFTALADGGSGGSSTHHGGTERGDGLGGRSFIAPRNRSSSSGLYGSNSIFSSRSTTPPSSLSSTSLASSNDATFIERLQAVANAWTHLPPPQQQQQQQQASQTRQPAPGGTSAGGTTCGGWQMASAGAPQYRGRVNGPSSSDPADARRSTTGGCPDPWQLQQRQQQLLQRHQRHQAGDDPSATAALIIAAARAAGVCSLPSQYSPGGGFEGATADGTARRETASCTSSDGSSERTAAGAGGSSSGRPRTRSGTVVGRSVVSTSRCSEGGATAGMRPVGQGGGTAMTAGGTGGTSHLLGGGGGGGGTQGGTGDSVTGAAEDALMFDLD